jgi:hypothetical protein
MPSESDQNAKDKAWIASIPQAVRTVNLSVVISLISLVISLFTLFWNVRPARVETAMSAVFASREGGIHISIPLSIVNNGARSTAVLAAKLIESDGGRESTWGADFTADPNRSISAITGAITPSSATLWVPFIVPGNGQIERVFIFRPLDEHAPNAIFSRRKALYRVVLLLSGDKEIGASTYVTWPDLTDAVLTQKKGGVGSMGAELDRWISEPFRK